MIQLQVISKILQSKDMSFIENNYLTSEYFVGYEEEFNYIWEHYKNFGNVPDKATFLSHFSDEHGNPTIELVEVTESDRYLIDTLKEEYLYYKAIPIVQKIAQLLKSDANAAAEYMLYAVQDLQPDYGIQSVDIISQANDRYEQYEERKNQQDDWFITTGFQELDEQIHGLQRGEEFVVIVARVNQGKSWVLEKICTHIWQIGYNVGYISPEMGAISVGYRFDTLYKNFSNKNLMWGNEVENYDEYIDKLKDNEHKFLVATPVDFQRQITITKLRNWVKQQHIDVLAIDGITYLTDERFKRGDNKTTTLTNISEDLMSLSIEMKIPILVVVQANRGATGGEDNEGTPELENIRDSDGIAYNASKVISIRQLKNSVLRLEIKKQRFGKIGDKLDYIWDIDTGDFQLLSNYEDAEEEEKTERKVRRMKKKFQDKEDAF